MSSPTPYLLDANAETAKDLHIFPLHVDVWTDYKGVPLLSGGRHAWFVAFRHGSRYWAHGRSAIVGGVYTFRKSGERSH